MRACICSNFSSFPFLVLFSHHYTLYSHSADRGGALYTTGSYVAISSPGEIVFVSNSAMYGGAIALLGSSPVTVGNWSKWCECVLAVVAFGLHLEFVSQVVV